MSQTGVIFDIQRFCVYDGPGIRTTVFLKGCNMRCKWCHNPESFRTEPELMYHVDKCTACRGCEVCPEGVHRFSETGEHQIDRARCTACGACAKVCPKGALEISGRYAAAGEIMEVVEKDEKYYQASGGGVTFSGGEASMQPDFLLALMEACKKRGYHVALETNGLIRKDFLDRFINAVDLFLFDYKLTDSAAHKEWTGVPNEAILERLDQIDKKGGKVSLRCPVIPGVNDNAEHFEKIRQMKERYTCIADTEIMSYHDVGKAKWASVGLDYSLSGIKTVAPEEKKHWEELSGIR